VHKHPSLFYWLDYSSHRCVKVSADAGAAQQRGAVRPLGVVVGVINGQKERQ
jgi:hypothetical protein